jgi:hypothetical protein
MVQRVRRWLPGRRVVSAVDGRLCDGVAGADVCHTPRDHGVAVALGSRAVSSPGTTAHAQTWAQTLERQAPAQLAGLGGAIRYALGDGSRGLAPRRAQKALGLLPHRLVVHTEDAPVAIRDVLVADPKGKLWMEAFFCTDAQATLAQILQWLVMRWSVEVTCEESRARPGLETQRQWSSRAIARTTPVLLALKLSQSVQIPVPATAWYHKAEPTFADRLALVRGHLWRARYLVNPTPDAELMQLPREALDLLIHGLPLAA